MEQNNIHVTTAVRGPKERWIRGCRALIPAAKTLCFSMSVDLMKSILNSSIIGLIAELGIMKVTLSNTSSH